MSTEIADAYVALRVKMPGVGGDIARALGGNEVQGETEKQGRSVGAKFAKAVSGVAVAGLAAVGTVAAAGLGTALVKGFQRLDAIDQAQAKLRGLGNDASSVDLIMSNALASVKGTAFGLGDAATVAAQAVAAGIQPGAQLQSVLKSVANSAAAAGTDLGSMGSIYAKVASLGKAQNDVLQQVADRGIPIYQALADQFGVTTDQVFSMASAGQVGFAQFEQAMTAAAGTVASEVGGTMQGSLANLLASLGRIGAGLLGPVFAQLAPTFQAITVALAPLEAGATVLGEKIGTFLAPAFEWLRAVLANGFDVGPFLELAAYLSPLGLVFQALQPVLPQIAAALGQVGSIFAGVLAQVLPVILPILSQIVSIFAQLASQVIPLLLPIIVQLAGLFGKVLVAVMPIIAALAGALMPIIEALIPIVVAVLGAFMPLISALVEALAPILQIVAEILAAVLIPILDVVVVVIKVLADVIKWLVQNIVVPFFQNILVPVIQEVGKWFQDVFGGLGPFFEGLWKGIQDGFKGFINFIIDGINGFLGNIGEVGNFISDITGGAISIPLQGVKLPRLADGGIIRGSSTGTAAIIGEAGRGRDEAVLPLPEGWRTNGIGGNTVVQNITTVQTDPRLQARQWAREAERAFAAS